MAEAEKEFPYNYKIAALGGGTGLPTLLEGLTKYNRNDLITAIPGTWDDGGSSGMLRWRWGIFPQGDARRCVVAFMTDEQKEVIAPLWERRIGGKHPLGNLIMAEFERAFGGHGEGINAARIAFNIKGQIEPISTNRLSLITKFVGLDEEFGESLLDDRWRREDFDPSKPPSRVYFTHRAKPNPKARQALEEADIAIISMGSLIGSGLPHFQVEGMSEAFTDIKHPKKRVYILNLTTEKGQTDALRTASSHLKYITRAIGSDGLDYMIVNDNHIDPEILETYEREGQHLIKVDDDECRRLVPEMEIIHADISQYVKNDELLRHDPLKLAKVVLGLP